MNPYNRLLSKASFGKLVEICGQNGLQVCAPVQKDQQSGEQPAGNQYSRNQSSGNQFSGNQSSVEFGQVHTADQICTDYVLTRLSAKEYVFPRSEKLSGYEKTKGNVTIRNFNFDAIPRRVIFGLRPCDAVGMIALGKIFNQEPKDAIFQARMERTTFISFSCTRADAACFCTSVGVHPGDTRGSDIQLTPIGNGDYLAEILTEKGQSIVDLDPTLFETLPEGFKSTKEQFLVQLHPVFDGSKAFPKINERFDTSLFEEQALACLGCGACAFVCPTCACFDIQDESRGNNGVRFRTWDSCGLKQFTLHTSGHNPRDTQGKRWRQRLMHKFSYMPERLEVLGCVGCGRCTRACPVSMSISQSIKQIIED